MIYQADLKRAVAALNGMPSNTYFHIPFTQWALIKDKATHGQCRLPVKDGAP